MNSRLKNPGILFLGLLFTSTLSSTITKGPYLLHPKQTSMTIAWESDLSEKAVLFYGKNSQLTDSITVSPFEENNARYLYKVDLANLKISQAYSYKVIMKHDSSKTCSFHTSPSSESSICFAAVGDSRSNHDIHREIADEILKIGPDFVISMGDLVATGGALDQWEPHFFEPAGELMANVPLISTLGDHDDNKDDGILFHYYLRPTPTKDKMWFSFNYGPAHFVSLDYRREDNPEMKAWFEKDMKQSSAKWNFVYLHRPSYNIGGHRSNWGVPDWTDLFRKHNIDIVFTGHSHIYERFYPMRPSKDPESWPVTYITTGGAGAGLYDSIEHENLAITKSVYHFIIVKLISDSLQLTTLLPDSTILDQLEIVKKNSRHNPAYLSLVRPQEITDVYMTFATKLHIRFNQMPSETEPAIKTLKFHSTEYYEDIEFEVILSEESAKHYRIEPFKGILKKGETYEGLIKLYSKGPVSVDKYKYFDPPLYLNAIYKTSFTSGIAKAKKSRYFPTVQEK